MNRPRVFWAVVSRAIGLAQFILLLLLAISPAQATVRTWTNTLGGSWFSPGNWSPNGVPGSADAVAITNAGTYTVLVQTGAVWATVLRLGGGSGRQSLLYGTSSGQLFITNSSVEANGFLLVTNGGLQGGLLVRQGGQVGFDTPNGMFLYGLALTNQGTISWTNGALAVGGNNNDTSIIANSGLLQIAADNNINYGGGSSPVLLNSGTIQKLAGTQSTVIGMDLINLPSGVVEVTSGTLRFSPVGTNVLGGSLIATAPGQIRFTGNQTDAGGQASGSGTIQFTSGTFYLRANPVSQLQLAGGDVFIAGTFQKAGAITNLVLDGAQLRGTNRIAGTLTVNSGNLTDSLAVQPGGTLELASPTGSLLYSLVLANQGTVLWSGNSLAVGGTVISNGGTWTMTGDAALNYGGGATPGFTNYGTVQKIGGTASSSLGGVSFINQPSGVVSVSAGTLQMPNNYTNLAGTLRLNGGTLTSFGLLDLAGGRLEGAGIIGTSTVVEGGTVSPGPGAGLLQFKSDLALGAGATLQVDGTGTSPGTQYDQLSVGGALSLSAAALSVTSLPAVPIGTAFVIITNTSSTPFSGTFNSLPENALLTVGNQLFRVRYSGGNGNDVVLVRASLTGPQLSGGGFTNNTVWVLGSGSASAIYTIQASTNFTQWTDLTTVTAGPGGAFSFVDTNASKFRYRYYRASN